MSTHPNDPIENDTVKLVEDIQRLASDIRLRLHLAGMDIKDEWAKLEPHVEEAARSIASTTKASQRGLQQLQTSVKRLRDSMRPSA